MSKTLEDTNPTSLACRINGTGILEIHHDDTSLAGDELIVTLDSQSHTHVRVADFEHENMLYRVNAATVQPDGQLSAWDHDGQQAISPSYTPTKESPVTIDVVITVVEYDHAGAVPASLRQAHTPVSQTQGFRIKVRKTGDKPFS